MKKYFFVLAAVIISNQLIAQDSSGKVLDEAVVTANKFEQKQSQTGKVVTVISRQDLEKNSGKTIGELLNTVAGVTIIGTNNVLGTNNTTSIRGASAGNSLILVNGIPLNDPSVNTNYFDLNYFSIDQIERIEILKGGQSTLYGSDAVAGVVNIILKKPVAGRIKLNGQLTAGSYSTFKQNAGISGGKDQVSYLLNYTHVSSKGFSAAYDENNTGAFDKDGFDQHVINTRLGFAISKKIKLEVSGVYSYYKTDLDASAFTDEGDYTVKNDNAQGGAALTYEHNHGLLRFTYNFNYAEREYQDDSTFKSSPYIDYAESRYIGRTHYAELYNTWKWAHGELLAGADYRLNNTDQYYFSTGMFGPYAPPAWKAKTNQVSPYTLFIFRHNGFTGEAGARLNIHSEYGSNFTYSLNPSYKINKNVKLFLNLYSVFKTPTLYQLFDPSAGNKDLNPETGIIQEAGIEVLSAKKIFFRVTGFYGKTKDAITYTYNPSTFESRYMNVSKQKNYGVETEFNVTVGKVTGSANYTYTDGKIKSRFDGTGVDINKDTIYYNLYRIPKHAINLSLGIQATKSLFVSSRLHSVSKREEFIYGDTPEALKSYATLDLYGEYKFGSKTKIFLDLKNITDKKYFDLLGYNSRRFNFTGGVSFTL